MRSEKESWNRRYEEGSHVSLKPDPFLPQAYEDFIQPLFPAGGQALDVAGGVGRHGLWLAQRSWKVTLLDISEVAIAKARENARRHKLEVGLATADARSFTFGRGRYDLVMVFFYLQREIFPPLLSALRPGGLLIYKTYTREQRRFAGGPSHPLHLLHENELLRAFPRLRVLHYRETIHDRGLAEFVGQKSPS